MDVVAQTTREPQRAAAVRAEGLVKAFGDRKALGGVSFELPAGSFLSIFGPNGAGKTTLLRILSTLSRPSAGKLSVLGIDALENPGDLRARIGLISHKPMVYGDLSASENLEFFARLYGTPDKGRIRELLQLVELDHRRNDAARTFSRGMTQRLSIARALVKKPEVYIFDDSFSALDFKTDAALRRALAPQTKDATVLIVAQRISSIMHAEQIVVMDDGRIAGIGTHRELLENCEVYREIAQSQLSKEELA